jgi:hypothetical protein
MDPQSCLPIEVHPDDTRFNVPYIEGDTRLVNISAGTMAHEFERQGYLNKLKTPLFTTFFSPENVRYIKQQIEKALYILTQEQVVVPINNEFIQTMIDIAQWNVGLAYAPMSTPLLNRAVIDHETQVQYSSLIRKKLYNKYFLQNDRMRTMPYGEYTRNTRGEVTISDSDYQLSHPNRRWRSCYLKSTQGLDRCEPEDGSLSGTTAVAGYTPIPNYLLPTVPPTTRPAYRLGTEPHSPADCYMSHVREQLDQTPLNVRCYRN